MSDIGGSGSYTTVSQDFRVDTFFIIFTDSMPPGDINSKILMHKLH